MTHADSGLGMNMVSQQPKRDAQERNVPLIRLEDDDDLRDIYKFGRKLGQGSFGVVYEATHIETQTKWAIKEVCRPAAGSLKVIMLDNEINILKQMNHASIIHLQEVYITAKMTYLVTELCVGGELKQLLQQKKFFTEEETKHIIHALADAVVYLHKRNIVHRDLKLENILVKNAPDEDENGRINIKVTDFGLSVQTGGVGIGNMMTEACGTLIYMAPEMMSGRGYSQWCDVWSIGIVMYMLLCGEPPFVGKTKTSLLEEINKEVRFTHTIWDTVTDGAKDLLTCLLKVDPAYRISASQILENPWITGDTNSSARPSNVLEMMHNHLEQEEMESSEEQSERSYGESDEPDSHQLTELTWSKESCGSLQQDKCKNGSETLGPLLHTTTITTITTTTTTTTTTQTEAGAKPSTQPSAKQRRPQDKMEPSTGQRPAPDLSKADDQRSSTSSKCRTGPQKLTSGSKTNSPTE